MSEPALSGVVLIALQQWDLQELNSYRCAGLPRKPRHTALSFTGISCPLASIKIQLFEGNIELWETKHIQKSPIYLNDQILNEWNLLYNQHPNYL